MTYTLDYTALTEPITSTDIAAYKDSQGNKPLYSNVLIMLSASVCLVAALLMLVMMVQSLGVANSIPVLAVLAVLVFVTERSRKLMTIRSARMHKFAMQNGLSLRKNVSNPLYAGMIFDNGSSRNIDEALWFGDGIEIGNYSYVTGSGKNRRTHRWAYVKVKLARRLPHMILDAKSNNFWKFSNLSDAFDGSQTLTLEGDFNNYFTLYAPKQYERDALYVFTPDVMAAMVDHGKNYDIEIVDDELYIYSSSRFALDRPDFYTPLLAIIDTIRSELVSQTDYYADERIGDRAVNLIAPEGQRLRYGFNWVAAVVIAIIVYFNIIHPILFR